MDLSFPRLVLVILILTPMDRFFQDIELDQACRYRRSSGGKTARRWTCTRIWNSMEALSSFMRWNQFKAVHMVWSYAFSDNCAMALLARIETQVV